MVAGQMLFCFVVLAAWTILVAQENDAPAAEQEQKAVVDEVMACKEIFPNATDPWMGQPDDASLDNMCLVKCVLEYQQTIVANEIVCSNLAKIVQQEIINLRAMKVKINEAGWKKNSEECCKEAIEAEVSVGDEKNATTPPAEVAICMRAHFLWHCDFQMMWRNIPPALQKQIAGGQWNQGAAQKQTVDHTSTNRASG